MEFTQWVTMVTHQFVPTSQHSGRIRAISLLGTMWKIVLLHQSQHFICVSVFARPSLPPSLHSIRPTLRRCAPQVTAGKYHSLARSDKGEVFAWGDGEYGKLGAGASSVGALTPQRVEFFQPSKQRPAGVRVRFIASGPNFNMAIAGVDGKDTAGALYAFGRNDHGQLGTGQGMTLDLSAMEAEPTQVWMAGAKM